MVARDTVAMVPIARYAAMIVMQEVKKLVKKAVAAPLSPLPSDLDLSSDKAQKRRKTKRLKKKLSRRKSLVLQLDQETCSSKCLLKYVAESSELSMTSCDAKDRALKLKFLHVTDSYFQSVVNYESYHRQIRMVYANFYER